MALTMRQIELAVEWWANLLDAPEYGTGDPAADRIMRPVLETFFDDDMPPTRSTAEQRERFRSALRDILIANASWTPQLRSDYGPVGLLKDAADVAELTGLTDFPFKANLDFNRDGTVSAWAGPGHDVVKLT